MNVKIDENAGEVRELVISRSVSMMISVVSEAFPIAITYLWMFACISYLRSGYY